MNRIPARLFAAGAALLLAALVYGCGGGSGGGGGGSMGSSVVGINVINNAAAPMGFSFQSPVMVKGGTTVDWVNVSSAHHGITWDSVSNNALPLPATIPVFNAGTTSDTWTTPVVTSNTTYDYHCTIHGPTMAGVITVTP